MESFTTSRGIQIEFLPIAPLLEKIRAAHPLPEPPTYEARTITGAVERHQHTAETIDTDDERAAWRAYLEADAKARADLNDALLKAILLRGLKVEAQESPEWASEQSAFGISIPTDSVARRLLWLETEILANEEDRRAAIRGALDASNVSEEALAEIEATFRPALEGYADRTARDQAGPLDGESEVHGSGGGVQNGDTSIGVRGMEHSRQGSGHQGKPVSKFNGRVGSAGYRGRVQASRLDLSRLFDRTRLCVDWNGQEYELIPSDLFSPTQELRREKLLAEARARAAPANDAGGVEILAQTAEQWVHEYVALICSALAAALEREPGRFIIECRVLDFYLGRPGPDNPAPPPNPAPTVTEAISHD